MDDKTRENAESAENTAENEAVEAAGPVKEPENEKKAESSADAPKPAGKTKKGPVPWLRQMSKPRLAALCGATAVVLIVVLLFACLTPPAEQAASGSWSESWPEESLPPPLEGIDLEGDDLPPPEAYTGTVLAETEDAGMEYLEETMFLGDSNTQRMLYYSDITGTSLDNCVGVVGMGIHSFESLRCVQFQGRSSMTTMVGAAEEIQPRRIVITFGSNNLGMAVNNFIAYYKSALEALKEACPYTDIIIGAVFPVDRYAENQFITVDMVDKFNAGLAALAEAEDVKFLNWHEALRDEKTGHCQFEYTIVDGIHLSREGMDAIFEYMRTHSYITEDERPERKGPAPKVSGIMPSVIKEDPYKPQGPYSRSASASSDLSSSVSASKSKAASSSSSGSGSGVSSGSSSSSGSGSSSSGSAPPASTSPPPASTSPPPASTTAPPATVYTVTCAAWDQTTGAPGGGTVSFDGGVMSVSVTEGGGCPTPIAVPDAANGYTFAGWSGIQPGQAVTGNITITALFVKTVAEDPDTGELPEGG